VSRLGPLREREFALLFTGRAISQAGSAMAPVALAFAVLNLTGSTADLGLVLAVRQSCSSSTAASGRIGCRGTW
jgi:hypothetical protein